MICKDIDLQLSRIEEIQERIRKVLQDTTLDEIEELCAELSSRLGSVIGEQGQGVNDLIRHYDRFLDIATAQDELARLGESVQDKLGKQLVRTRTVGRATSKYTNEAGLANARTRIATDITS